MEKKTATVRSCSKYFTISSEATLRLRAQFAGREMTTSSSERASNDAHVGSGNEGNRMSTPTPTTHTTRSPAKRYKGFTLTARRSELANHNPRT